MRLLIFGGRNYGKTREEWEWFISNVFTFQRVRGRITCVIHGVASGADTMGWAMSAALGVPHDPYPAAWGDLNVPGAVILNNRYGKPYNARAGFDRNETMATVAKPDFAMGFPGGRGTLDMALRFIKHHGEEKLWNAGFRAPDAKYGG